MNSDHDYYKDLQRIAQEQDRAKFTSMLALYSSELKRLPKIRTEIDALYNPTRNLDFIDLARSVEIKLKAATNLILELDSIPDNLKQDGEVINLSRSILASLALNSDFADTLSLFKKTCNDINTQLYNREMQRIADEKKRKAEQAEMERRILEQEEKRRAEEKAKHEAEEAAAKTAAKKIETINLLKKIFWYSTFALTGIAIYISACISLNFKLPHDYLFNIGSKIGMAIGFIGYIYILFTGKIPNSILDNSQYVYPTANKIYTHMVLAFSSIILGAFTGGFIGMGIGVIASGVLFIIIGKIASKYQNWFKT